MVNGGSPFTGGTGVFPSINGCGATMTSILTIELCFLSSSLALSDDVTRKRGTEQSKVDLKVNLRSALIFQN
jgi:hypothetical protein